MKDEDLQQLFPTPIVWTEDDEGEVIVSPADGVGVCDFCAVPEPVWDYPCDDFEMDDLAPLGASLGGWAACEDCSRIVEDGNMDALALRVVFIDSEPGGGFDVNYGLVLAARELYERFSQSRTGPRVPLEPL